MGYRKLAAGGAGLLLTAIAGLIALACVTAACITTEAALHPVRHKIALLCPCIAHTRCGDAAVKAPDGTDLRAWYYQPDTPNGKAVLILHGVGSSREDSVALGYLFLKAGYAVLEPDLRGHGTSGGFTTYGVLEEQDVHAWVSWMLSQPGVTSVYGFGSSLGGSVLIEALKVESRFRGVIAESAFSDFESVAKERMARTAPAGMSVLAGPFVRAGMAWARLRYSLDLTKASPAEALRKTHVPVLLIHGLADHRTSPDNSRRLQAANPSVAKLWLVPGAGDVNIRATIKGEFDAAVLDWFAAQ